MKTTLAVLLTCHNRKDKTLQCLQSLFNASLPVNHKFEVFLVDDGSIDGTGEAVNLKFPVVNVIKGSGNLFWNKGMRLAWQKAVETKDFNFYLWLNDDTFLDSNAIENLLNCYAEVEAKEVPSIITGACRISFDVEEFSYGGRSVDGPNIPNGNIQRCRYINGNFVLVPKIIYKKIGILSNEFTHAHGDFEYGIRAINAGFSCFTTKKYIATCLPNVGIPSWCNPHQPILKRLSLLNSPLGFQVKEYSKYIEKDKGFIQSKIAFFRIYFRALFPRLYINIKHLKLK